MPILKYPSLNKDNFLRDPLSGLWVARNLVQSECSYGSIKNYLYKEGFQIPSVFDFMSFFTTVVRNIELSDDERKQLLESFTGEFLNAKFVKGSGFLGLDILTTKTAEGIKGVINLKTPLEPCLAKSCFADLDSLNPQGYPTKEAAVQEYKEGENFFFKPPIKDGIAVASRYDRFQLDGTGTSKHFRKMGIRPCIEGDLEKMSREKEVVKEKKEVAHVIKTPVQVQINYPPEIPISNDTEDRGSRNSTESIIKYKKKLEIIPYQMHSDPKRTWDIPPDAVKEVEKMLGDGPNPSKYLFYGERPIGPFTPQMNPQDKIISYWVMLHKCNYLFPESKKVAEDLLTLAVARIMYREYDANSEEIAAINQFEDEVKRKESLFEDDSNIMESPILNVTRSVRRERKSYKRKPIKKNKE